MLQHALHLDKNLALIGHYVITNHLDEMQNADLLIQHFPFYWSMDTLMFMGEREFSTMTPLPSK
jgi:hypothetical protein